jgi:hypothetical protein
VAIRYGAALADPQIAAMVARGKTQAAHSAASNGGVPPASQAEAPPADHDEAAPADPADAQPASQEGAESQSA